MWVFVILLKTDMDIYSSDRLNSCDLFVRFTLKYSKLLSFKKEKKYIKEIKILEIKILKYFMFFHRISSFSFKTHRSLS